MAEKSASVPVKSTSNPGQSKRQGRFEWKRAVHLIHRLLIVAAAWRYIITSFQATHASIGLLGGQGQGPRPGGTYPYPAIIPMVGTCEIRSSPLVTKVLESNTTPRNTTIYLSVGGQWNFAGCPLAPLNVVNTNEFIRYLYTAITRDAAYQVPQISDSKIELIAPFVDCAYIASLTSGISKGRYYYLVRERANPERVFVIALSISNHQYNIPLQAETGPAGAALISLVFDVRVPTVKNYYLAALGFPLQELSFRVYDYLGMSTDGQYKLRNIPASDDEIVKDIVIGLREGFYIKSPTEQSNINSMVWEVPKTSMAALTTIAMIQTPVLRDSWAWVHGVQLIIGLRLLGNLIILCVATINNLRARKLWVGSAFVSITKSQLFNSVLVIISWFMNRFWSLHEFCICTAYITNNLPERLPHAVIMRADLMTLYFGACAIIGLVLRERVDPLLATVLFEIAFDQKLKIIMKMPKILAEVKALAISYLMRGLVARQPGQNQISPMLLHVSNPVGKANYRLILLMMLPFLFSLACIVAYVILRKIYRRVFPPKVHIQQKTTGTARSANEESLLALKRVLTLFEVATGAELETRFGLCSDYDTCVFVRGEKFASADGIYTNGFVIANEKYLVQASDIWTIVLMKILRKRFINVYVYEVNDTTVHRTARLVYPHTLTVRDLLNLNVSVLS
ncbi:hypothetical protein Poli38472_003898 [Pythium oligandrum]|uniref:Uncharacterized protein n=1 Tax=Pythium oligandrum TaxID=41045 RepID=A0A8K1FQ05_PYTOL|nr:hypothetical protein Poli38472_003898 [Pythium oligandrum]|eukprot:TMW66133.1 hypothetical protein Poli38472_003898 [Pythium oligandrum]